MANKNIAVITGASSGLGKEFVKRLVKDTNIEEIWAIARNKERLENLKEEFGSKIKTFSIDLSNFKSVIAFAIVLKEQTPNILYLINDAGAAKFGSYDDLDIEQSINLINLNCGAVVSMGLACIPYMQPGSHILNIASKASFQPVPYLNLYAATKAFVRSYSRALNVELREKGISVTAVCPGWIKTDLLKKADIGAKKTVTNFEGAVTADDVAEQALIDARKNKDMSVYGIQNKVSHILSKILPTKVIMNLWLKQQNL